MSASCSSWRALADTWKGPVLAVETRLVNRWTAGSDRGHSFAADGGRGPMAPPGGSRGWRLRVPRATRCEGAGRAGVGFYSPQDVCCADAVACALRICFSRTCPSSFERPVFRSESWEEQEPGRILGVWRRELWWRVVRAAWDMAAARRQRLSWSDQAGFGRAQRRETEASFC